MILKQKLAILLDIKIVFVDDDKDEESFDRFRLSACVGLYGLNTKITTHLLPHATTTTSSTATTTSPTQNTPPS